MQNVAMSRAVIGRALVTLASMIVLGLTSSLLPPSREDSWPWPKPSSQWEATGRMCASESGADQEVFQLPPAKV